MRKRHIILIQILCENFHNYSKKEKENTEHNFKMNTLLEFYYTELQVN